MCADISSTEAVLDLSESRTYECALDILRAYKLTNNFPVNLEVVLKDLDALADLTFEIEPKPALGFHSDHRQVVFRRSGDIGMERFAAILRSIEERTGYATKKQVGWTDLLGGLHPARLGASLLPLGDIYNALMKLRLGRSRIHTGRWAH